MKLPSLPYGLLGATLVLLLGGLAVMRARGVSAPEGERGWRATRAIPPFTVIDSGQVARVGAAPAAGEPAVHGRLTVRPVAKDSLVRERALAAVGVEVRGRWLVVVPADSALRLRSGAPVFLVGWGSGDTTRTETLGPGQVVAADSGRAVVALPADLAARAARYHVSGRLAVARVVP